MTKTNYQLNELIDLSKRFHHQSVLFYHPPIHKIDEMFIDHIVWSGFAGGPITGLAISKKPAITLDEAKEHFFHKALIQSNHLMNCPVEDLFPLIEWDGFNQDHLSFEEQLDLRNRQLKYIAPHLLYPGVEYKLPYLYPKFFDFVMSLPEQYRIEQYLFRNIMMRYYPTLFQIPTKRIWGLPLTAGRFRRICRIFRLLGQKEINRVISLFVDPNINYINFTQGIRERKNLKMIIFESIHDLKSRKIIDWIDFERLWKEHMYKKRDHSMALILLASLEIHLKAGKKL